MEKELNFTPSIHFHQQQY